MFTASYIATNRLRLAESYSFVTSFLKQHSIPYLEANAAFFLWVNLGAVVKDTGATDDGTLVKLRQHKVYLAAGYAYKSEESGWFRMVFAHPVYVLEEGLKRLVRALDC